MSNTCINLENRAPCESPFSGRGVEFDSSAVTPDQSGLVLHEAGYLRANQGWNFPGVLSPFWRLYYNSQPGQTLVFRDRQIDLGPDVLALVPDHQQFLCLGELLVPSFWVQFSLVGRLRVEQDAPIALQPDSAELGRIGELSAIIEDTAREQHRNRIHGRSRALVEGVLSRSEIRWQESIPDHLEALMRYIAEHVSLTHSDATLAGKAGVSTEILIHLFQKHLGIAPGVYVTQVRIRTACQRLLQTNDSIEKIARSLGFPDRANFSRVFKRITGESPAAYRKR